MDYPHQMVSTAVAECCMLGAGVQLMGAEKQLGDAVTWLEQNLSFDLDERVHVFELTIRALGEQFLLIIETTRERLDTSNLLSAYTFMMRTFLRLLPAHSSKSPFQS